MYFPTKLKKVSRDKHEQSYYMDVNVNSVNNLSAIVFELSAFWRSFPSLHRAGAREFELTAKSQPAGRILPLFY